MKQVAATLRAVGFDFGQTLAELDYEFLQRRVAERGVVFDPDAARAASVEAWRIYGLKKDDGHAAAWQAMMRAQLSGGGVPEEVVAEIGEWLWREQPRRNLWRKPIPGMIELVRDLKAAKVPLCIISNSEGYLAELVAELGWAADFDVVVDSGRVQLDKPDPRIFQHACRALAVETAELLHVGDAWEADVRGALGAGGHAVWFDPRHSERALPPRVFGAGDAAQLREVLARVQLLS